MKKTNTTCFILASLLFGISSTNVKAQNTDAQSAAYPKQFIKENPTADQDVKALGDYINALLVSGDLEQAKSFLAENYKGFGPGINDSATAEQVITTRKEDLKTQLNRKVSFVENTWQVTEGIYKGNWVAMWGEYDFTTNGKDVRVPFQTTARITNGKIEYSISYWDNLSPGLSVGYTLTPPKQN